MSDVGSDLRSYQEVVKREAECRAELRRAEKRIGLLWALLSIDSVEANLPADIPQEIHSRLSRQMEIVRKALRLRKSGLSVVD
jgi:hypothetical protein